MSVEIAVQIPPTGIDGDLNIPPKARGIVVFAHGSGSSRHSSRNRYVAGELQRRGLATLLMDLLTEEEEAVDLQTRHLRFDIGLLSKRLVDAVEWLSAQRETIGLNVGFFGASTGAGAALVAATRRPESVAAEVSRGGRPDLAGPVLPLVRCPTLLLVGSRDEEVIELNRSAMARMRTECKLEIIQDASHLFEEPGTLDEAAMHAGEWFQRHLGGQHPSR